jgi:hypothetical protein
MQLLAMKFYTIGTIMMSWKGFCEAVLPPKLKNGRRASNKTPKTIARATYQLANSLYVPTMKSIRWYVHMLATGSSGQQDRIVRRDQETAQEAALMEPRVVKDYQTYMGALTCMISYVCIGKFPNPVCTCLKQF